MPEQLPYFAAPTPRVLAHRGLATEAPENTLLAFAAAVGIGITHIETDVHASADGVAMVAHDPDLSRVEGRATRVDELTARELAELDLGDGQHMPTLAEALDGFPDAFFNIDLKTMDAVAPTVDAISAVRAQDRVLLTSFSERRRRAALRLLPDVATSASGPRFASALLASVVRGGPLVRAALRGLHAVQIPERALGLDTVTPARIRAFHAAGVEVHVWTINDADTMTKLLQRGVDGIVTDRADIGLEVVTSLA
ncbi:glycerophosphodiester phosphodiesterase family protein [Microcella sp.]|uniref:glycerophosphodiester phosphodiesterase family protein n=1 Tax=Microcella sp. TaxID=1913979 RepID=UPI00256B303C|nr:glycerophosphodiester phosphodiesterase family protein [Microcella sp.]MBX9470737.1 glycerophosphodiester phosphodiesterase [Microcella sp.]